MDNTHLRDKLEAGATVRRLFAGIRGLLYATGFVLVWGWVALSVRPYDAALGVDLPSWLRAAGIPMMILGGIVALTCVASFAVVGKGTPAPFDPPREFVAVGPYQWVRNPMYIGGLAVFLGFGLSLASLSVVLTTLPVAGLVHAFVALFEEPQLERRFRESYIRYKRSVNRWSPRRPLTRTSP